LQVKPATLLIHINLFLILLVEDLTVPSTKVAPLPQLMLGVIFHYLRSFPSFFYDTTT